MNFVDIDRRTIMNCLRFKGHTEKSIRSQLKPASAQAVSKHLIIE
jgi:hypothetical protein